MIDPEGTKAVEHNDGVTQLTFRLRATLDHRQLAIDLISTLIKHVDTADTMFLHELITAFGEAYNNIVIHGYRDQADGMLDVEAEWKTDEMTLRLIDTGHPVDFGGLNPPDLDSMPERGMGVYMIHALTDEVLYRRGAPNVLSLRKRTTNAATET